MRVQLVAAAAGGKTNADEMTRKTDVWGEVVFLRTEDKDGKVAPV